MIEKILRKLVKNKKEQNIPDFLIINFLKEYLQYPVLDFLYKDKKYRNFIFTGGSCLRICHDLPRLSEDLDFDLNKKDYQNLDLGDLKNDLLKHFKDKYLLEIQAKKQQKKRIYLKFPVLRRLNLNFGGGSDFLYVKIEPDLKRFKNIRTEIQAISNFGYNFIVKKYPLSEMMSGRIIAIFTREWFQGSENEIDIKGRDFYDLFWYFQHNVEPNYQMLKKDLDIKNWEELKLRLKERIGKNITARKLKHDIKNFLPDQSFAENFCLNYQDIMKKYLI